MALVVLAAGDVAVTAYRRAGVVDEALVDGVAAVRVDVYQVQDHGRAAFVIEGGVSWRWTDADVEARDVAVRSALERLASRG